MKQGQQCFPGEPCYMHTEMSNRSGAGPNPHTPPFRHPLCLCWAWTQPLRSPDWRHCWRLVLSESKTLSADTPICLQRIKNEWILQKCSTFRLWGRVQAAQIHTPPHPCSQQGHWARASALLSLCLPKQNEALAMASPLFAWLPAQIADSRDPLQHLAFSSISQAMSTMNTGRQWCEPCVSPCPLE